MTDNVEPEVAETVEALPPRPPLTPCRGAGRRGDPVEELAAETPCRGPPRPSVEAPAPAPVRAPRPGDRPIQTVGRRKEAIVRVRLVPGTGKITCNGRDLEEYFPSKVHQQLIREPLDHRREARAVRRHRQPRAAAASPARPVRCASASPGRSSRTSPTTARP